MVTRVKYIILLNWLSPVLNISEPVDTIESYLSHPKREPDYRQGRNHLDFVTSLLREGYMNGKSEIISALKHNLEKLDFKKDSQSQANV